MGTPQFHTPSVHHISSTQKGPSFSAPKTPSVPHQKSLSSTLKTLQFNKDKNSSL